MVERSARVSAQNARQPLNDPALHRCPRDRGSAGGGKFGRTVYSQGEFEAPTFGRDHHGRCFTSWMAGGGVKAGYDLGATDDYT